MKVIIVKLCVMAPLKEFYLFLLLPVTQQWLFRGYRSIKDLKLKIVCNADAVCVFGHKETGLLLAVLGQ